MCKERNPSSWNTASLSSLQSPLSFTLQQAKAPWKKKTIGRKNRSKIWKSLVVPIQSQALGQKLESWTLQFPFTVVLWIPPSSTSFTVILWIRRSFTGSNSQEQFRGVILTIAVHRCLYRLLPAPPPLLCLEIIILLLQQIRQARSCERERERERWDVMPSLESFSLSLTSQTQYSRISPASERASDRSFPHSRVLKRKVRQKKKKKKKHFLEELPNAK